MPNNHYYHYDHETRSFVEAKPNRTRLYEVTVVTVGALLLALDRVMESAKGVRWRHAA